MIQLPLRPANCVGETVRICARPRPSSRGWACCAAVVPAWDAGGEGLRMTVMAMRFQAMRFGQRLGQEGSDGVSHGDANEEQSEISKVLLQLRGFGWAILRGVGFRHCFCPFKDV